MLSGVMTREEERMTKKEEPLALREVYGRALLEIGGEREDVVVLDADVSIPNILPGNFRTGFLILVLPRAT